MQNIFHKDFLGFEEWLVLSKNDQLSDDEKKSLIKTTTLPILLEFTDFNAINQFKGIYLKEDSNNSEIEINIGENKDKSKNIIPKLIFEYKKAPILWILISYEDINEIQSFEGILKIYSNNNLYLCLHNIDYNHNINFIHESLLSLNGNGIKVGILDTGIDTTHPDLKDKIKETINITNEKDGDYNGHGTHLAGIIAGNGKSSGEYFKGISPRCSLIDIKIFNENGQAKISDLLVALDFILDRKEDNRPDILLFGFTSAIMNDTNHIIFKYIEKLFEQNIAVVVPAGNFGPDPRSIPVPSTSKYVITVGTINEEGKKAFYSGRDCLEKDINQEISVKPDAYIEGSNIISLKAFHSKIGMGSDLGSNYISLSGTSVSAAIITAFLAILKQGYPKINVSELYSLISKKDELQVTEKSNEQEIHIPNIINILKKEKLLIEKPNSYRQLVKNSINSSSLILLTLILFTIIYWWLF